MQEDYVELIADLIADKGEARAADLAERFGVTAATVANTLGRLKRDGLVEVQPYRSIFLTAEGAEMACRARARHQLVVAFLLSLGVSRETAELDAEGLEHHLSPETLDAMARFSADRPAPSVPPPSPTPN
jgi:DtxR family manganese transport transcriptional regulator